MESKEKRPGINKLKRTAGYLIRSIALIVAIIAINFVLVHVMPGDPLMHILGDEQYFTLLNQFPEQLEEIRQQYSLDGNILEQFVRYLKQVVTLLWTFKLPWQWAYHGTLFHPGVAQFAFGFYSVMLTSTVLGLITMVLFKPRSWCVYCPMGTMTQLICKAKNRA